MVFDTSTPSSSTVSVSRPFNTFLPEQSQNSLTTYETLSTPIIRPQLTQRRKPESERTVMPYVCSPFQVFVSDINFLWAQIRLDTPIFETVSKIGVSNIVHLSFHVPTNIQLQRLSPLPPLPSLPLEVGSYMQLEDLRKRRIGAFSLKI